MVERRQACKKHFSVFFLRNPDYRAYIFSLHKTAHFLIKQCICSARQKFFGPGPQGKILGGIYLLPMESDGKFAGSFFWSGATGQDFWRAKIAQAMKKYFLVFFLRKPEPRRYIFCLCKTAHFLIKRCNFSARGKNFGSGTTRTIFSASIH